MMLITTLVVSFLVCCVLEVRCSQDGVVSGLVVGRKQRGQIRIHKELRENIQSEIYTISQEDLLRMHVNNRVDITCSKWTLKLTGGNSSLYSCLPGKFCNCILKQSIISSDVMKTDSIVQQTNNVYNNQLKIFRSIQQHKLQPHRLPL